MKSTGLGDTAYFGPEPEFFVFDSVRWGNDMSGCFFKIESEEAAWNTGKEYEHGNNGFRPPSRVATSRCRRSTAARTCARRCA
jgi:glutamine synthetase